jgi:citrate synthase
MMTTVAEKHLIESFIARYSAKAQEMNRIPLEDYERYNVKRGLRNADGTGVLVGLTTIGNVHGYILDEGERVSVPGKLYYRGIDVEDLVRGFQSEGRTGYEETAFLLLFGSLPNAADLADFRNALDEVRDLPAGFTENMILKAPSRDIMNKLARCVLVFYSYDANADDLSVANNLRQGIELIARFPIMTAYAYQAKAHYHQGQSLYLHNVKPGLSTAGNILRLIRPTGEFSKLEEEVLDLCLVLHAEHGGGNNSAFTVHVVTSSGTDCYSAIAAGVGSLKGPKHGGANIKVMEMMEDVKANVRDWASEKEVRDYLGRILRKEAYDRSGLIYGLGHAVYTLSDPRAVLLKAKARGLSKEKESGDEFHLYELVEKLAPAVFAELKDRNKVVSVNVDFYSGFVYKMLNIPQELYTPLFAIARIAGWAAHRVEEITSGGRIMRPAYKSVNEKREYVPLGERS